MLIWALKCLEITIAMLAFFFGLLCFFRPDSAIKLQQKFYEQINWKIEPINLNKELKNTRIMGIINLTLAIIIVFYSFKK